MHGRLPCQLAVAVLCLVACGAPGSGAGASRPAPPPAAAQAPAPAPAAPTAAPAPVTLRFGQVTLIAQQWPLFVGEAKGVFEAEGITLDVTVFRLSSDAARALSSDSVDLSNVAADSGILAVENGADTISIAGVMNKPLYNFMVSPDVRTVADLRGKTLGASDLKDGSTILLQRVLEKQGLRPSDYDMVQAGGTPDRFAALKTGAIAGTMISQPNDFLAMADGYPSLLLVSDVIPDYQFSTIAVRRSWAQRNEDVLLRFLRAYARACEWMYEPGNKAEAIRVLVNKLNINEDIARKTYELYVEYAQGLPKAGELNLDGMRGLMDIMTEMGNLPRPTPPLEKYADPTYLERARR
jgi:ABC-type nitrate/sulfonate/bicarbonate transport system substrate-binding protein